MSDSASDGATNMAVDEALLLSVADGAAPPTIRVYGWLPPALSLGYFQSARREVAIERCRALGVDVVRRPTGGRAVLHDRELTYSVVAPEAVLASSPSILSLYREISRALIAGLAHLGIEAQMIPKLKEPRRKGLRPIHPAACFALPSAYEVVVGRKKVIGSAQKRLKGCVLQQGSVLLQLDRELLFSLFLPAGNGPAPDLGEKMTSLGEVLGREVSFAEAASAMKSAFGREWGILLREGGLTEAERRLAEHLKREKYAQEEWNLRR